MPTNKSKATKRRTKVEEIPAVEKKLDEKELKKVKGGKRYSIRLTSSDDRQQLEAGAPEVLTETFQKVK